MSKKNNEEKVEKKINKELKKLKDEKKIKKEKKKDPTKAFENKEKEYFAKRAKNIFEITVIVIISIIMLILLCNRTFFKEEYKTSKIDINIPLLMFFEEDTGNQIILKTLRKSQYVIDYFDGELGKMPRYSCNGYSFYYDDLTNTAIYNIKVEKSGIIKTVTIDYAVGDFNCLCNVNTTGASAEMLCN